MHLTRESGLSLYWSIAKRQGDFYCFTLYFFSDVFGTKY
jgi:hypothetical protein